MANFFYFKNVLSLIFNASFTSDTEEVCIIEDTSSALPERCEDSSPGLLEPLVHESPGPLEPLVHVSPGPLDPPEDEMSTQLVSHQQEC